MKKIILLVFVIVYTSASGQVSKYLEVIDKEGSEPVSFIKEKLKKHDLIIFDDALHNALEPFQFYKKLLKSDTTIDYVFVEVFGINSQQSINQYLASKNRDSTLLYSVFQDNFGGLGWYYETYFDLLKTVWSIRNQEGRNLQVIGVDQPVFWQGIQTKEDFDTFRKSLSSRDYFMYQKIIEEMNHFKSDSKAIFLTNTRHAYKNISNKDGVPYWNSGTFFHKWHPQKTFSARFHNVTLSIEAKKDPGSNASIAGMDRMVYSWKKMDNGLWDQAFEMNANKPVAIPLISNAFGNTDYMGNHMLNCKENQKMSDAYDAIIFLAPLEELHSSAKMSFFYTEDFKEELIRRLNIIHSGTLDEFLGDRGYSKVEDYIDDLSKAKPVALTNLL